MKLDVQKLSEHEWLTRFFAGRNTLLWADIVAERVPSVAVTHVIPWLVHLVTARPDDPIVLPVMDADGPAEWYAAARTRRGAAQLAQEVAGFIGPTYSSFDGRPCELQQHDPIEGALKDGIGGVVYHIRPLSPSDRGPLNRMMARYRRMLARRPEVVDRSVRPIGAVRGDFERALLVGDRERAKQFADELSGSGRLTAEQRKCIEIRRLAGLGDWRDLAVDHGLIASVMEVSLPPQTIVDLVEALYRVFVEPTETQGSPGMISAFQRDIAKRYGPLFAARKGIARERVLRAFLLFELAGGNPDVVRCDDLRSAYGSRTEGREVFEALWASLPPRTPKPHSVEQTIGLASQALLDDTPQKAYDLFVSALPSQKAVSGLLRAACELGSGDVARDAIGRIPEGCRLSAADRGRFELLQGLLRTEAEPRRCKDWLDWARFVRAGAPRQQASDLLERSIQGWSVADYRGDLEAVQSLVDLIGNADPSSSEVFRDAFPRLYEFFCEGLEVPERAFSLLYGILLKIIGWSGATNSVELELAYDLVRAMLQCGPTEAQRIEIVDNLKEILKENAAPVHLDWALNCAELLSNAIAQRIHPLGFFEEVTRLAFRFTHRLQFPQRKALRLLARDFSREDLIAALPEQADASDLGQESRAYTGRIAIYSLMESAAARAKEVLQEAFPDAAIETNADHVATQRLKNLAKEADIFVFAWKSSKHQAYYAVKEARGSKDLLLPAGKGSASIVKSVCEFLA